MGDCFGQCFHNDVRRLRRQCFTHIFAQKHGRRRIKDIRGGRMELQDDARGIHPENQVGNGAQHGFQPLLVFLQIQVGLGQLAHGRAHFRGALCHLLFEFSSVFPQQCIGLGLGQCSVNLLLPQPVGHGRLKEEKSHQQPDSRQHIGWRHRRPPVPILAEFQHHQHPEYPPRQNIKTCRTVPALPCHHPNRQ